MKICHYFYSLNNSLAPGTMSLPHEPNAPAGDASHLHLSFNSEHRLRAENLSWDIDVWYPLMKSLTYTSHFIPLTVTEALAIREFHDVSWRHTKPVLEPSTIATLISLEHSIDDCMNEHFGEKGAFIRMCGRSPKDGEPLDRDRVWSTYQLKLQQQDQTGHRQEPSLCDKMLAIAGTPLLRVCSGADVLALLLSSERVYADMLDWTRFGEPEQLCLRAWSDALSMDLEFRVFVHDNTITGISQYDHYSFFPHLPPQESRIRAAIHAFWAQRLHPTLRGMRSYVADVGWDPTSDGVTLIELSPFFHCTGSSLFRWEDKRDSDILHGRAEPEFRMKRSVDEVHPQMADLVEVNWEQRWAPVSAIGAGRIDGPYWDFYGELATACPGGARAAAAAAAAAATAANAETDHYQPSPWSTLGKWLGLSAAAPPLPAPHTDCLCTPPLVATTARDGPWTTIFVYGTLKQGFAWNRKYLHPRLGARRLGEARTCSETHAVVVGDSGVPYLLLDAEGGTGSGSRSGSGQVRGECWEVSPECLRSLDDYEGCSKGYYSRIALPVLLGSAAVEVQAQVYVPVVTPDHLRSKPKLKEYTVEIHREMYHPIKHIQVKQLGYIKKPSTWGRGGSSEPEATSSAGMLNPCH